jgi:hypothetical protein
MKRLEYVRRIRSVPAHATARNAAEAVMVLAHVARERHRLQQERRSLGKRIDRIEARLIEIAGAERRLVPVIQALPATAAIEAAESPAVSPPRRAPLPAGVTQVTLQY